MSYVLETARRALRRRMLNRFIGAAGVALTAGAAVGVAGVVVDRLFGLGWSDWILIGAPTAAGVLGAGIWATLTPRDLLRAAAEVDRSLALQDRLGSAIALRSSAPDDPFAALAIADAETVAAEVRVSEAAPLRFNGAWWSWPIVLTAAVAGAIFLPVFDLVHRQEDAAQRAMEIAAREEAAREVADAVRAVAPPDELATSDFATAAELKALEELEQQLASGEMSPDEARAKAAGALNESAHELEQAAAAREEQLDALRDELRDLPGADASTPGSPLAKALSQGDFEKAQQIIEEYQQTLEQLEEEERQSLAEELRRMAEAIPPAPTEGAPSPSRVEEALRDLGVNDETIEQTREETDPAPIREALREQGLNEQLAEQLAEEAAKENQQRQALEQAQRDAQELKQALEEAARETMDPPSSDPSAMPPTEQPQQPQAPPSQPNQPSTGTNEQPLGEAPPQGESQETGPGSEQPQSQSGPEGESPQPSPDPNGSPEPGAPQSSPQQGAPDQPQTPSSSGESPQQTPQSSPEAPNGESPSPVPSSPEAPQPTTPTAPDGQPAAIPQPDSSQQTPDAQRLGPEGADQSPTQTPRMPEDLQGLDEGELPEPDAQGLERARRLMKEFNERQRGAQEQRQIAERARRQAKELLDRMSPEQREQLDRWARELAREGNDPVQPGPSSSPLPSQTSPKAPTSPTSEEFAHAPVDLRPQAESPDRVIAQWFNPEGRPEGTGDVSRRVVDQQLQDAAQGAERAVEEQSVHRRYNDIIKRYFDAARKKTPE